MSMDTHIVGFRPADERWKKMKEVWDACESAHVPIPKVVSDYFNDESPGDKPGMEVDIGDAVEKWGDDGRSGYEVNIDNLPIGVGFIRFYNSW